MQNRTQMPYEIARVNEPQNVAKEFLCEIVETLDVNYCQTFQWKTLRRDGKTFRCVFLKNKTNFSLHHSCYWKRLTALFCR
jgi:hypothetical protein